VWGIKFRSLFNVKEKMYGTFNNCRIIKEQRGGPMENIGKRISEKFPHILVVYFSKTGNTRKVAQQIAKELGAEIEEIIDLKKRSGIWGFLTGGRDALRRRETEIKEIKKDPSCYDLVIAGSPIWAGNIVPAVRSYLNRYKTSIKSLALFTTSGGAISDQVFQEVRDLLGKELVSLTGICTEELKDDPVFMAKLSFFVEGIGQEKYTEK